MIRELLLKLPLYLTFFLTWWRFRHATKAMADVENILNDDEFSGDTVDNQNKGLRSIENNNA